MSGRAEMIGVKFNRLTPVEVVGSKRVHLLYKCLCECGNYIDVLGNSLRTGNTKSCGCIRRPNLIGYKNDHGTVISKVKNRMWIIKCKHCNNEHIQNQREIKNNAHSMSCENYRPSNYSGLEKRDGIIRRQYGITLAEYDALLETQDYKCAICGNEDEVEGRRLAIDHCHTEGHIRGLLCGKCNRGLGLFYDKPELLQNAINYLSR